MVDIPANANGVLPIHYEFLVIPWWPWWSKKLEAVIVGGPYSKISDKYFGVCVREEKADNLRKDVWLPIIDFQTPPPEMKRHVDKALLTTLIAALDKKKDVWVGCWGGIGRTGLFLALLAKVMGETDPVNYVRSHYIPHAVETKDQQRYVQAFDITWVRASFTKYLQDQHKPWWLFF